MAKNQKSFSQRIKNYQEKIKEIRQFLTRDVWRIPLKDHPPSRSFFIRQLRIILLAFRGFAEDRVQLRASALTFYSMLSIVPIVAMGFGVAKGFGLERKLEEELINKFSGQEEVLTFVIDFANNFLERTKGGVIAGVGLFILFWAVMKVLGNIESSFNDIWQIKKSRPLVRKFTDYISFMLVAPVFIIVSSSITVYINTRVETITESVTLLSHLSPFINTLLGLIPYILIWALFTLIYIIMPNIKVNFASAVIAGIIAGTLFQLLQWGYIHFQIGVTRYGAIYGGFAALPLFLVWLQFSWLIVLFGAEISFANQNVEKYEFEAESLLISSRYKRILTLLVAHHIIKNFKDGVPPVTASDISLSLHIPVRIVREVIFDLVEARILVETFTGSLKDTAYQPAQDINRLSVKYVIDTLDKHGINDITIPETEELKNISNIHDSLIASFEKSPSNILLKDL